MILRSELFIVIVVLFVGNSLQIPHIPCPSKFQYARSGDTNFGLITIDKVNYGETVVEIELSHPGLLESDYAGNLNLNFDKDKIFDYISSGSAVTYKVDFPVSNVLPQVTAISVNGASICSGSKFAAPSTTVTLKHTLTASGSSGSSGSSNKPQLTGPQLFANVPSSFSYTPQHTGPQLFSNMPLRHRLTFTTTTSPRPHFGFPNFLSSTLTRPKETFSHDSSNPFFTGNEFHYVFTIPSTSTTTTSERPTYSPRNPPSFLQAIRPTQFVPPPTTSSTTTTTTTTTTTPRPTPRPTPQFVPPPPPPPPPPTQFVPPQPPSQFVLPRGGTAATQEYINSVCGQENMNFSVKKLAINGDIIARARFPWIVALYKKSLGALSFQCGGSLISTRTVISAAHCFYSGYVIIKDEDILVSMGRHNLTDWSDSYIIHSDVERVIRHPDYRPELVGIDADLAIVRLKNSVPFSHAIRPVCMWQGPLDLRDIEGVSGIVVGWGRDENNNDVTTSPRLVTANIATELTCIRSNEKLFYLTSNRTLCAGNRDGTGPCNGDSGSGLMIRNRNKWMIRGTVSAALGSEVHQCNLDEFVVYTDIAKFIGWINANMLL